MITLLDAMDDGQLFKPWVTGDSWDRWRVFLKSLFALPLSKQDLEIYRHHTGRSSKPRDPAREAWLICGRRSGKSFITALCAVYLAAFRSYAQYLGPGEVATIPLLAADRKQARVLMRYVKGLLEGVPLLSNMITSVKAESIDLDNMVTLEIHTASYSSVRGYTIPSALCDEISFWSSEDSANPDVEIVSALRPAMATIPGSLLLCLSSPYSRRGALWNAFKGHYCRDGDPTLVWRASSREMNPKLDRTVVQDALEQDPQRAASEWLGEFRSDLESFVSKEVIDACTILTRHELPWFPQTTYRAFCDPSGGSSDSFTLAIAHPGLAGTVILDAIRERKPPFSPDGVVEEFANVLKSYRLSEVYGDRYAGEWPRERFGVHGIAYRPSEKTKSEIYLETLPLLNAGRVELLDHPKMVTQLCGLERRTSRSGKDSIDHSPGGHDDLANSVCGALVMAQGKVEITPDMFCFADPYEVPAGVSLSEGISPWIDQ